MTPKEYLQQVKKIDHCITNKLNEIEKLREMCEKITTTLQQDKVQSGGSGDKMGDAVARVMDLQNDLVFQIQELVATKKAIMRLIDKLEDNECDLLYKRYFQYKTWESIAAEMNYSYQWACKLHGQALQHVKELL